MMHPRSPNGLATYDADTLSPLPGTLRHGLVAVAFFGYLSFFASLSLFFYLTFKFVSWRASGKATKTFNQFLLLLYNLVLADIQQSLAFLLTSRWLAEDKIHVGTSTCFVEGWFVSTGDLASSVWIFAIALHTYLAIIRGYKIPFSTFVIVTASLWAFVYGMAIVGIAMHPGDYYTRAGAWCWVNGHYEDERLYLHYLWIFMAMLGTISIYTALFINLQRRAKSVESSNTDSGSALRVDHQDTARAARYMVIYPFVYVLCTLPLASVRVTAMAGKDIPYTIYCFAGAAITSNGWLDVILYALTRRTLVFSSQPELVDPGNVGTFGIYPHSKAWGTTTTIEGGIAMSRYLKTSKKKTLRDRDHAQKITSRVGSMEDLFNAEQHTVKAGQILTKSTVKVERSRAVDNESLPTMAISMRELKSSSRNTRTPSKETDADSWFETGSHKSRFSN